MGNSTLTNSRAAPAIIFHPAIGFDANTVRISISTASRPVSHLGLATTPPQKPA
jgi:hypothetical protein